MKLTFNKPCKKQPAGYSLTGLLVRAQYKGVIYGVMWMQRWYNHFIHRYIKNVINTKIWAVSHCIFITINEVNEIENKWKPVILWTSFFVINLIFAFLVGMSRDTTIFERTQFSWIGCDIIFLGGFGLRFKGIYLLKGLSFSYDEGSVWKRRIGLVVNIFGLSAGIVLFCYGVYVFLTYSN